MKSGIGQAVQGFWGARNQRERNMLLAAIAVIVAGLVYALLLDPALSGRAELEQRLPTLRQQAAEVRALTREASAGASKAAPVAAVTRDSLAASLERRGLKAEELSVSGEVVRARFASTSFAGLVDWLSEMHKGSRLAVTEAKVEAAGEAAEADNVNATFTLRQQRGGQAQ